MKKEVCEVGRLIRKYRKQKGFTQKDIAKKLGVTQETITQFETSRKNPKIETIQKIATALDVPAELLLQGVYGNNGTGTLCMSQGKRLEDYTNDELITEITRRMKGEVG